MNSWQVYVGYLMVGFHQLHLRPSRSLRMAVILFRLQVCPGSTQASAPHRASQTIALLGQSNVAVSDAVTEVATIVA